ncbi:LacI family transcriptional regulator [Lentzea fradiae]|uniref:LacI family transcriptional regulator n=1 Tax=Lentzea fradiae TaxID=200378 RepID=A0A1G7VKR9_9PSEU|nr:LacI family transcriptional regulator [Lentzea fradiae]
MSKVLNQRYGVSADTFARVTAVIKEMGYEASLVAQSLRNHRTNVIGILVADIEPFSTELLKGAADAIRGTGFELVVYSAGGRIGDPQGWEHRYLTRLSGTLVDGAVLVTPAVDLEGIPGTPVVAVDPHTGRAALPTIDSDNLHGGRLATEHLLALGHRRIALITGREDLKSAQQRETGYRGALASAGLPVDENLVRRGDYEADIAAESARRLLREPDRPTAVFAANDITAIAVIQAAQELGLRVPEDLAVVGFDNIPESALCTPPLTTVQQPIREMGHRAVELLVRLINGDEPTDTHITLSTELVVRQSTRPLTP